MNDNVFEMWFQGSGFDRGHLAPAGNHKQNQELCNETFLLSNIAPQVGIEQAFCHDFDLNRWFCLRMLS